MLKTRTDELASKGLAAKQAARELAKLTGNVRNRTLLNIANRIVEHQETILDANRLDLDAGSRKGLPEYYLDRMMLNGERLEAIASDVRGVAGLPDPVGEVIEMKTAPNGLQVGRRRVPLGVVGVIYESRPNVTVDISTLCLKSGNAVILRGGSDTINSNTALANIIREAIADAGAPRNAVQLIESTDRELVGKMLDAREYIDLLIPRGGQELINRVARDAKMPAITGGVGVCHTYVDKEANLEMAADIVFNAKVQRYSVCNAMDTLLVHSAVAPAYLPKMAGRFAEAGVEMRCDRRALSLIGPSNGSGVLQVIPASEDDWSTEFLALIAGVRVVDSLDDALDHIETYGSGHSDAIVTEDYSAAMRFVDEVDSSAVFVNCSTRFNDGGQFGLGAEVAISTNKFHARGPMGLKELTSYKWTVMGSGQVRT
ncbi:MAG: glutamate-5-semialdehyde dehydrogenase [Dehalococcoidia bacterium]|nr:glutamate-5-semialdehyde dehydrogenase [Dehalococcoidia bacterium]